MDQHEREDPLHKMLERWEPAEPSAALDDRVMRSYRAIAHAPGSVPRRAWFHYWLPAMAVAVGLVLGVWLLRRESPPPKPVRMDSVLAAAPSGSSLETSVDSSAFRPVKNAKIVVISKGASQ
jgi:hypothetical protein